MSAVRPLGPHGADGPRETLDPVSAVPKILVLEDSPIVALDIEEELRRLAIGEVVLARDVAEAMAVLDEGDVACALLDHGLQDDTADAVAERMRAERLPFAWISGRETPGDNAEPTLEKPFTSEEMARVIGGLLDGGSREAG